MGSGPTNRVQYKTKMQHSEWMTAASNWLCMATGRGRDCKPRSAPRDAQTTLFHGNNERWRQRLEGIWSRVFTIHATERAIRQIGSRTMNQWWEAYELSSSKWQADYRSGTTQSTVARTLQGYNPCGEVQQWKNRIIVTPFNYYSEGGLTDNCHLKRQQLERENMSAVSVLFTSCSLLTTTS